MPRRYTINFPRFDGGTNVARGEKRPAGDGDSNNTTENIDATNMRYVPEGGARTALGYSSVTPWETSAAVSIDGLFACKNYPDLAFKVSNGSMFLMNLETGTPVNVDTGLSLTAGTPVFMGEYRGQIYFTNGTENMGRIAVARLLNAEAAASTTWELQPSEGYKFNNAADKVYSEGDEVDYATVSSAGAGDNLETVTNGLAHDAGDYVTQYNSVDATRKGKTFAFWKDTMWVAGVPNIPNVLYYGKTVSSVATVNDIHNFTDNNNYLIGEGGAITALQATRDRLYIFTNNAVYYVGIAVSSTGTEVFSPDTLFTKNYGVPNAFCVAEVEDVVLFFTGTRLIRIGFEPYTNQLLPDETFDAPILPLLKGADKDQSLARLAYDPVEKRVYLTYRKDGLLTTVMMDYRSKKYASPYDFTPSQYMLYKGRMFFGARNLDKILKMGTDLNADGIPMPHRLKTGRVEYEKGRKTSRYVRGYVDGLIAPGTVLHLTVNINGKRKGDIHDITDAYAKLSSEGTPVGSDTAGEVVTGSGGPSTLLYPFKYPFLISSIGEDIQLIFTSLADGSAWEIENSAIDAIVYERTPYVSH